MRKVVRLIGVGEERKSVVSEFFHFLEEKHEDKVELKKEEMALHQQEMTLQNEAGAVRAAHATATASQ